MADCKRCNLRLEDGTTRPYCTTILIGNVLDLINRLQEKDETRHKVFETKCEELEITKAENERLKEEVKAHIKKSVAKRKYDRALIKAEAYKEFAEQVQGEIDDAIHSNYNAKEERQEKCKKFGIPIAPEDSFLMYCDGKIRALSGLQSFVSNLLKELVGDYNADIH